MAYPATLSYKRQAKSSPLWALLTIIPVKLIMLIPHAVVWILLSIASGVLGIVGVIAVLINGRYPESFERIIVGFYQYSWRLSIYSYCMTDKYPPFSLKKADYNLALDFKHEKSSSRLWALLTIIPVKTFMLIPHMVVLFFMDLLSDFAGLIGIFAVLFTGNFPKPLEHLITAYYKYSFQVVTYALCMTDKYPPISWEE